MERYQPDQYGRMMPDAHGQWVSLRAAEITALDAAQKSSADAQATMDLAKAEGAAEVRKVIQQRLIDVRLAQSVARLSFAQDEYDAQISALESILKQCEEPFSSNNENGPDWQATVEALQAQLDKTNLENAYANNETQNILRNGILDRDVKISALRQQVEALQRENAQLKALVRTAVERWRAQTNVKEGISFRMAMKALEATLGATTPAGGGTDGKVG